MSKDLNPVKALIFRIVHINNLSWILDNGLHCPNSKITHSNYVNIGNPDLIAKRHSRSITVKPYGNLSDYVPFYFTPYSPMFLNIKTGYGGIKKRPTSEIAILVSSLHKINSMKIPFLFTDRHAYLKSAQFFNDLKNLHHIDWDLLQSRDFKRDPEDPEKLERYQAEALIHSHVPTDALLGAVCHNSALAASIGQIVATKEISFKVISKPEWYV